MREMEFKVERSGLINVGDELNVTETELENFLYYTIEHAYGMSGNIPFTEALKTRREGLRRMKESPGDFTPYLNLMNRGGKNYENGACHCAQR